MLGLHREVYHATPNGDTPMYLRARIDLHTKLMKKVHDNVERGLLKPRDNLLGILEYTLTTKALEEIAHIKGK